MSRSKKTSGGSLLLAEEYFEAEDSRFVEAFRWVDSPKALVGLADRWKKDPRPWARQQIFVYLSEPLDAMGHNPVVKRLFKHAEAQRDDELMAAFLVVFDCLVRRVRKTRRHYDWRSGDSWQEEYLATGPETIPLEHWVEFTDSWTGKRFRQPAIIPRYGRLFSAKTRGYLRRRAWRYFRYLGFQRPDDYVKTVARALTAYQDNDLKRGENVLDSWGLVHACFRYHDALEFGPREIRLAPDRGIADLAPAPRFPELWKRPEAAATLYELVTEAKSRLVRVWAMQLFQRDHAERVAELPVDQIFRLLRHDDSEVQKFGAELLTNCPAIGKLPVATWLELLTIDSPAALETICELMAKHVSADRFELADCIRMARSQPAPIARAGLALLKDREIATDQDREAIAAVASARCAAVAGELAEWALGLLGTKENYHRDWILRFFDAFLAPTRQVAWQWLMGSNGKLARNDEGLVKGNHTEQPSDASPGADDPGLWCRLMETPYDDIRLRLIDELTRRASLPGVGTDDLSPVWSTVLLGVHRGGRQKLKAVRQVATVIERDPDKAESLLPVLGVAVRSIRGPEFRAGLAGLVGLVARRPELADRVARAVPELELQAMTTRGSDRTASGKERNP